MRCWWLYTKNQKRCKNECSFLLCKTHCKKLCAWLFPFLVGTIIKCSGWVVGGDEPFILSLHIVDWNNRTDNQEIYNKKGIIYLDGKKEYSEEITEVNKGKIKFHLPSSYNDCSVRVHFENSKYEFMKLDTIIEVHRNSLTHNLKMYFDGIDKITRIVEDTNKNPIIGAIVEIDGITDTTSINGKFTISLPLNKQRQYQKVKISKTGFRDYYNNKLDMTLENRFIIWNIQKK